jgi:hypothetical protein
MSDFVTRLEAELHRAAVRQDGTGTLRGVPLPRVRFALPGLVGAALATAAVLVALLSVVVAFIASSPERRFEGGVPAELRHAWRLPSRLVREYAPMTAELRFYPRDSKRCMVLGLGSKPCYAIDGKNDEALEWGTVAISEDLVTFRADQTHWCLPTGCNTNGANSTIDTPGVYRWRLLNGSLRLTPKRDGAADRPEALASGPLVEVGLEPPPRTRIPEGWTRRRFVSRRYGYALRYPRGWSARPATLSLPEGGLVLDTSRTVDKLSPNPRGPELPLLMVGAYAVARGTSLGEFTARIRDTIGNACPSSGRRSETIGSEPATITIYPSCDDKHHQWATFLHGGRGYQITWSGAPGDAAHDRPLFERLLATFAFKD